MDSRAEVAAAALSESEPAVMWLDRSDRPDPGQPLAASADADLVIVGAGYTGLCAALQDTPGSTRQVVDGHGEDWSRR